MTGNVSSSTGPPSAAIGSTSADFLMHTSITDALMDRYDGFILDQFGVLHNGVHGLEGAPSCVERLYQRGKKLVILSNSSSLSDATIEKLPQLGFDPQHFVAAVTSGEEAARHVGQTYQNKKPLFLTWKTPKSPSPALFLEKCGDVSITTETSEADFILLHGSQVLRGPGRDGEASEATLGDFFDEEDYTVIDKILKGAKARNLPMVCANPDFIYVRPDGSIGHMPGKIAKRYEEKFGGQVISFGKPHAEHFQACVRALGLPKEKVVHVGDSLHHDIAGANAAGMDSIFVVGGVHREELGCALGSLPTRAALQALFAKHGATPTHVVPMLNL